MNNQDNYEKEHPALEQGSKIIEAMDAEFHDAPDRVLAVVGAAYLDSLVEDILRATFIPEKDEADRLLKPNRPLGSNGARYQLAYCLGLIGKEERDDLETIAAIRNAFAHRYDIRSFEHERTKEYLSKLHYGKELDFIIEKLIKDTPDENARKHLRKIGESGRKRFQDTVRSLFINLLRRFDSLTYKKRIAET
jgi:DNA-binding MltR family transcriptional regulator